MEHKLSDNEKLVEECKFLIQTQALETAHKFKTIETELLQLVLDDHNNLDNPFEKDSH